MKRIVGLGLALCLVLSMVMIAPFEAQAATRTGDCTGNHEGEGWKALRQSDFTGNKTLSGKYYLAEDITVTNYRITISAGKTLSFCLNGHKLEATALDSTSYFALFYAWNTSATSATTVNICDCSASDTGTITVNKAAAKRGPAFAAAGASAGRTTFNFYGGTIRDGYSNRTSNGGTVRLGAYGTLNMYEGAAIKNIKYGGVHNCRGVRLGAGTSIFNMYGGTISNDTNETNASPVTFGAAGTVNIYGGTIDGTNSAAAINALSSAGTVNLYKGTIVGPISGSSATINYPVTVNTAQLTQGASATPGTISDANGYTTYNLATSTLTVNNPAAITSLTWDSAFDNNAGGKVDDLHLTVKLGDDWTTSQFDTLAAGKKLTIDLNGNDLTTGSTVDNSGTLTLKDTSDTPGIFSGRVTGTGTLNDPQMLSDTLIPVYVNTDQLSNHTTSGTGYTYDAGTNTLTVTDPSAITALSGDTWGGHEFTVKLGANWTTTLFDSIAAGQALTIDLNGHTLTTGGEITNAGTLTLKDTSSGTPGSLVGTVTNTGDGVLHDEQELAAVLYPVYVSGSQLSNHTASGTGYTYDAGTNTLTVTDPSAITALDWEGETFTLKLGANWDTSSGYDPLIGGLSAKTLTIDLNGKTIGKPGYSADPKVACNLALTSGATLTIKDSTATTVDGVAGISEGMLKGYRITVGSTSTLNLKAGAITDGYIAGSSGRGGGVYLSSTSSFVMDGGKITGNRAGQGGGLASLGTNPRITINDGMIYDNSISGTIGDDIYCIQAREFTVMGGVIGKKDDSQENNPFTIMANGASTSVNIYGGTIYHELCITGDKGNKTKIYGGDIREVVFGSGTQNSTVTLYGGRFTVEKTSDTDGRKIKLDSGKEYAPSGDSYFEYMVAPAIAKRANARLSDDLTMYLYVPTPATDASKWTFYNGTSTPNDLRTPDLSKTTTVTVGSREVSVTPTTEDGYYKIAVPIYAKEMAKAITVIFKDSQGNAIRGFTDKMTDYAARRIEANASESEVSLMKAMLNYGAAAVEYFGGDSSEIAAVTSGVDMTGAPTANLIYTEMNTVHPLAYHSANLILEEKIDFAMHFWVERIDPENKSYTVKVDGEPVADGTFGEMLDSQYLYRVEIPFTTIASIKNAVIEVVYQDKLDGEKTAKDTLANYLYRNQGLAIDDAPQSYTIDATGATVGGDDATVGTVAGTDNSELYAKLMAFANSAVAYASATTQG